MSRRLVALLAVVVALVPTSCAGSGPPSSDPVPSPAVTASRATSSGDEAPGPASSTASADPSSATEKLVLRRQIEFQVGGDGLFLRCRSDDEAWQEPSAPAVWLNTLYSINEYPGNVVLCLKGFAVGDPITVSAAVGATESTAVVTPTAGPPDFDQNFLHESLPSETLFDGRGFKVYTEVAEGETVDDSPSGLLISDTWRFVPPVRIRDELASSGRLTIKVRQGDVEASGEQAVRTPTSVGFEVLERTGTSAARRLVAYGYPAGATIPIGLYRRPRRDSSEASLAGSLGNVLVPPSRVAELGLEDPLREQEPGFYCVAPPTEAETSCAQVEIWPTYPGQVAEGERGEDVRRWQQILIQAEIIADRASNRDGYFGPATAKVVASYLEDDGIPNPDGAGRLGPQFYRLVAG